MRSITQQNTSNVDEENPYWISFSDLMSALLVVFILAVVALIIELTEKSEQLKETIENAETARKNILYDIKEELAKQDIIVTISENDTVLRIPESTLTFRSDSFQLPYGTEKRKKIETIGVIILNAINKPFDDSGNDNAKFRYEYLDTVFIEGHTDSRPSKRKKGNWGLSTFRAISLWEFWQKRIHKPMVTKTFLELKNADGNNLFSVSGYASSRPTENEEITKEQRKANRRIDIRFTIKRPKLADIQSIVN